MTTYWRHLDLGETPPRQVTDDPFTWPDGPDRRLALGHRDEPDVPAYCTCGELTRLCPVDPRRWHGLDY